MNLRETLKSYLQRPYESIDSFLANVIYPVFGEDKFVFDGNYNVLKRNPELQPRAEECGIQSLTFVGHILTEGQELNIFDITVNSHRQLARSRVAIQSIVKSLMGSYSGAFMIFHYRTMEGRWDWRFTFCQKGASNADSSDAKRYTFLLGPSQSCRTAAENFMKIHDKIEREGEFEMDDIVRAFDVEALSKEFFDKYVDFYQNYFVKYMCDEANGMRQDFVTSDFDHTGLTAEQIKDREEKPIRDYLKKLLGRLVFLQFLQKKGWMGVHPDKAWGEGDYDFMRQLFLHATPEQQANFLDGVLEPLFTALNTQRSNDLYDTQVPGIGIVKIPYLNGGLFERDSSDEPITVFPAEYFGKLLEFFYEYNFTIDENDPNDAEVGVDPEMLGKIFESQLEDNKDKGAFYTPKEIVQYMCRESLVAYLTNCAVQKNGDKFPREETEKAVRNLVQTPEVIVPKMKPEQKTYFGEALRAIKICDPAIGSGAFPMGLLNELVRLRIAIGAWADKPEDVAALKKEIIQNNIYGVDIEQGAIDIARLRFWLSIMVDLEEPEALPNFDYKFMQGNSLITTFGGEFINLDTKVQKHERWEDMDKEKHVLYDLKKQYYTASGEEKLSLGIKIKDSILRLISMQLGYESRSWVASHSEQLSMFEEAKQLSFDDILEQLPEEKKRVINLCKELHAQLENKSLPLATRAHTDIRFFDWRMMFTEVFDNTNPGFDIVIGNPPYIDSETMTRVMPTLRELYTKQFSCAKGNWDMFVLFIELGMKMLAKSGVYSFIIPNKLIAAKYTETLRNYISNNTIFEIRDYGNVPVFTNASVYPATIVGGIGESYVNSIHFAVMENVTEKSIDNSISTDEFANIEFWDICFQPSEYYNLFSKINRHPLLKADDSYSFIGAATVSEAYLIKEVLLDKDSSSSGIRMVNTGTIDKYTNLWGVSPMQYIKGRYQYPIIEEDDLNKISAKRLEQAKSCKIIVAGMSKFIEAIYDDGHTLAGKSTTIILGEPKKLKYLLAILNSNLASFFTRIAYNSLKMAGGFINVGSREMENIPVPVSSSEQQQPIINLVDAILAAKRQDPQADTTSLEAQIDALVYQLYNLTPEEIALIEQ